MNKLLLIYDDSASPSEIIKMVVGEVKFSQIICHKRSLFKQLEDAVANKCRIIRSDIITTNDYFDHSFIWIPSSSVIVDIGQFNIMLDKLVYAKKSMNICENGKTLLKFYKDKNDLDKDYAPVLLDNYYLMDISNYTNFVRYLSQNPDARFFNTIVGDANQFTKTV